ncbi:MAG: NAD(P)-dependent oxidoreductase [Rhodospirillaceae bacterium]|nr:NAD(P)-dependent oxidoreductase [Rhodospirillaceae bacterium]
MSDSSKRLFCFGLGYSARRLAAELKPAGWHISGTCRSEEAAADWAKDGIEAQLFDGTAPMTPMPRNFFEATHILSSVPPSPEGDSVLACHGADIASQSHFEWVGYLSTTGVYGNRDGGWVDEESARTPTGDRGRRRVAAEDAWLDLWHANQIPVHLFRLAGIYGPGRNALETVRKGRARRIDKPGQVFSRIHVDDIAQILLASIAAPDPGQAYNVCDDEAAAPEEVIAYACELLAVEAPPLVPFENAELSDMARSFYADNKRVSNSRIKNALGVRLQWDNYRAGLKGLLDDSLSC